MTPIIIFGISLLVMLGIIVYQTRQIKLGRVEMVYDDPFDWPAWRNKISNWLLDFSRVLVISGLRLYIRLSYFIKEQREHSRRQFEVVRRKIAGFLERKKVSGPVSDFLSTIGEYKEKIQEIKKEIEEEKNKPV